MMSCEAHSLVSNGYEGAGFWVAARISSPIPPSATKVPLTRARVVSIAWKSYNPDKSLLASGTYDKNDVIHDSLQEWEHDETGYNFFATIAGTNCPLGEKTYRIEITITHDTSMKTDLVILRNTSTLLSR